MKPYQDSDMHHKIKIKYQKSCKKLSCFLDIRYSDHPQRDSNPRSPPWEGGVLGQLDDEGRIMYSKPLTFSNTTSERSYLMIFIRESIIMRDYLILIIEITPGWTRTINLRLRRPLLYPVELRVLKHKGELTH